MHDSKKTNGLYHYAGLAMQWLAILLLSVWGGKKADQGLKFSKPVFSWLLPVVAIVMLLFKVVKDTRSRN
ncbi:MAG: hypothetical protein KGP35_08405 [Bacteroidetes bacterium]|nr:hypothetical protein [Bacteroidota bacterium]